MVWKVFAPRFAGSAGYRCCSLFLSFTSRCRLARLLFEGAFFVTAVVGVLLALGLAARLCARLRGVQTTLARWSAKQD
jgi:uncharacterized membrane protein YphA (DoxX/SURF4 family)